MITRIDRPSTLAPDIIRHVASGIEVLADPETGEEFEIYARMVEAVGTDGAVHGTSLSGSPVFDEATDRLNWRAAEKVLYHQMADRNVWPGSIPVWPEEATS